MTPPCLTENGLSRFPTIRHGFFTREGGASKGIYASLNAGPGSQDNPARIMENRCLVREAMGMASLVTLYQVHGRGVVTVNDPLAENERPEGDALVTNRLNILLGVLAADCVPVLFADPEAGIVGAAHAGWKGALAGVTDATLEAMEAIGGSRSRIHTAVGPCIGAASYEVDRTFRDRFLEASGKNAVFFRNGEAEKFYFDIRAYVAGRLMQAGVPTIGVLGNDTYAEESRFFSYRRATHRAESDYGRQISVIGLASV